MLAVENFRVSWWLVIRYGDLYAWYVGDLGMSPEGSFYGCCKECQFFLSAIVLNALKNVFFYIFVWVNEKSGLSMHLVWGLDAV